MSRFYTPAEKIHEKDNRIIVDGEESHHILDVMRMVEGDPVVVFDGSGKEYSGIIRRADRKNKITEIEILSIFRRKVQKVPEIDLAQAIPKKSKIEYVVEKATELGVCKVFPVVTKRTIVRLEGTRGKRRVDRWRKIAREAAKQCGRSDVPEVSDIRQYDEFVKLFKNYDLVLHACLSESATSLKEALSGEKAQKVLIVIGPEGGFTPGETEKAKCENCIKVSLGRRVLKSDTAGLYLLSVVGYEME